MAPRRSFHRIQRRFTATASSLLIVSNTCSGSTTNDTNIIINNAGSVLWQIGTNTNLTVLPPLTNASGTLSATAYVIVTNNAIGGVCLPPGRVDLGTVTWGVSTNTTNFNDGSVTLVNTLTNTNFCVGDAATFVAATNVTPAVIVVTTNYMPFTNLDTFATNYAAPVIVTNWWTVSGPGIYTNFGTGLSASFTPTNLGAGTNTFYLTYSNTAPCDTNLCTAPILSVPFTVIALQPSGTNCASPGSIVLTNAMMNTTNACLGTTFTASAATVTNFGQLVLTNVCPCDTNYVILTTNAGPAPTIISNWWAITNIGATTTNGTGTNASFTPTNCGIGTVTFCVSYSNSAPYETSTHTNSTSIIFTAHQTTITFEDGPWRSRTNWPCTWQATLQAVCVAGTNNVTTNYLTNNTSLASISYGFTVDTNGVVTMNKSGDGVSRNSGEHIYSQ